ncbi:hypothetical protein MKW92_004612 [Papaver armeniacum]|nr:hypothetical protein MKW92_004612 [Papaver armeniacum]
MDHLSYQREVKIVWFGQATYQIGRETEASLFQSKLRKFQAGERSQREAKRNAEVENSKPGGWWF